MTTMPVIETPFPETGNLQPLLHEILHALEELVSTGTGQIIDLRALPLAPGEEKQLLRILGTGELSVRLDALGRSNIQESRFSGVWITTHFNSNGEIMGRFVEITRLPELLAAQPEDMAQGLEALRQLIAAGPES